MDLVNNSEKTQDRIFSILFQEDELTWQNIIYDLVKREGMDPWDIDVSEIAHKFLQMLKKLKEMDFRISGKVVLASALLLKIKSNRLIEEDITALDNLMSSVDEPESLLDEFDMEEGGKHKRERGQPLMPRTPQPRKRKVSVYDLIKALEKALEVEVRRSPVYVPPKVKLSVPKAVDVGELINEVLVQVQGHYDKQGEGQVLTFSQLVPSDSKEDKVYTFIPLLHLENQRKVDMDQKVHFGEISIHLARSLGAKVELAPEQAESVEIKETKVKNKEKKASSQEPKPKKDGRSKRA
ncbi:segregation/condensation protein A [Candidatus Woesearchaeota archaeon]|nr:segregation/condensation protein A [Candidatus Woesearchaeota archaeon]